MHSLIWNVVPFVYFDDWSTTPSSLSEKGMGRRQGPKVMAYFLFMQEQRQRVPGWANRSNAELQRLCDPLWKALSKEEKAVYKEQKKMLRKTERENRLQVRIPQEAKRVEFEGKRWPVKVGRVESPDLIWVVPNINDLAVQKLMSDIAAAPLEVYTIVNGHT